ncbi:MAG: 23S rRNA (pseudouridine(1915)-N(3))-methyltransferase RlmH [Elusimicrobiota bacterium]
MKTTIRLAWHKRGAPARRAFKQESMHSLVADYMARISRYSSPCAVAGGRPQEGANVWVCDRGRNSKRLSSEEIAGALAQQLQSGRDLEIVIGGADGLSPEQVAELKPSLLLSFGPMTLPHELAAVVACEQLYRAWTIIKKTPYHLKH